ncbi:hypothetical protein LUZ62_051382 [Rhynchospora pubera]|uniref:BZIP transcription factor n=1 Tax=Rhynchospora pubera TaxID=906938 RepID=A0AAV8G8N1_9POAL|nr:hypothetical protein LUZ62_051382 [Rhynchospora pubera]
MGCKGSKLDDQKAVALCRGRSDLLAAAVRHRYALADSHAAMANSLLSFSDSLHQLLFHTGPPVTDSPTLPLPPHRKPDPSPPPNHRVDNHPRSHSGSHLHFRPSDSEAESDHESGHSSVDSPLHDQHEPISYPYMYPMPMFNDNYGNFQPHFSNVNNGNTFFHMHYAKSRPPPASVTVQHRPPSSETVYSTYGYNNPYSYGYDDTGGGFFGGAGYPTYPTSSSGNAGPDARPRSSARTSQPPPSPPRVNTWDFLNPFEINYDNYSAYGRNYYAPYTPSRSSREVREEEGIPDLEEENYHEVVKEAYGDEKSVASSSTQDIGRASTGERSNMIYQQRYEPRKNDAEEVVQEMVDKKVVSNEGRRSSVAPQRRAVGDVGDFMDEIKIQFQRSSEAAGELGVLLEVGKRRFQPRSSVYQVSSRMASAMAPLSISNVGDMYNLEESKTASSSGSLCLTLQKLYIWEKKLYNEVKAEEKMRLLLAKNTKRLKLLDERGAETHKIDATRKLVRKLSTKIRIAIQVVNSVSHKINKVRDEELCPQLIALIQGFAKMWREILDCHEIQCQIISETKNLDSAISDRRLSSDATMQLEVELMKWSVNFSSWVNTQKSFVKALNGWLSMCLNPETELTEDGPAPYSPGRIGAPPIFVICNFWSQAVEKISDDEVVGSMRSLVVDVKQLSKGHFLDQAEHIVLVRERERWAREMERKMHEINKEVDLLNKKLALVPGQNVLVPCGLVHGGHLVAEAGSFQMGLKRLLESLKGFATNSLQVYEDLHMHAEREARSGRENTKVP